MRIAFLWTHLSGYFDSCLRALAALEGVEVFVAFARPDASAPFDASRFSWLKETYSYAGTPEFSNLRARLQTFAPDVLLVSSWHISAYRNLARTLRPRPLRVLCMDNQWLATPKQRAGVLAAPLLIAPSYDAAFVPGERQAIFAHKLGFAEQDIWRGLYSCDHPAFANAMRERELRQHAPKAFVCIARLSPEKGIDTLVEGYARYRSAVPAPWPLIVCGSGPLRSLLDGKDGVTLRGFVQPAELPSVLVDAGAMILASRFEPWGVVIHEAAASGTPIICTTACGAAPHLVSDGFSGYLAAPGDPASLARALTRFTSMSPAARLDMGRGAYTLSLQYTPQRWAEYVVLRAGEALRRQ